MTNSTPPRHSSWCWMLPLLHARSEEELHPTQSFAQLAACCMIPLVLVCTVYVRCHAVYSVQLYSAPRAAPRCTPLPSPRFLPLWSPGPRPGRARHSAGVALTASPLPPSCPPQRPTGHWPPCTAKLSWGALPIFRHYWNETQRWKHIWTCWLWDKICNLSILSTSHYFVPSNSSFLSLFSF